MSDHQSDEEKRKSDIGLTLQEVGFSDETYCGKLAAELEVKYIATLFGDEDPGVHQGRQDHYFCDNHRQEDGMNKGTKDYKENLLIGIRGGYEEDEIFFNYDEVIDAISMANWRIFKGVEKMLERGVGSSVIIRIMKKREE